MKTKLKDGKKIACSACQKQGVIRVFGNSKEITLLGPEQIKSFEKENTILRCQECNELVCFSCASKATGDLGVPKCPKCGAEGGPYFIMR